MSQVKQFLKDLNKQSGIIKRCTQPLSHLGITCFYYVFINEHGDHCLLTDCPYVDEYYYQEKLYLKDPYLRHPKNYQSGFFLFENTQKQDFDASLRYISNTFNIQPLIGLCEKHEHSVEFFGFWGESNNSNSFDYIYLNYTKLLKRFADYFKKECQSTLKTQIAPHLSLKTLIGPDLFNSQLRENTTFTSKSLQKYLEEIGFKKEVKKANLLSRRECECIKLLVHGKSAKETAILLNLSHRTIEHYFENIKNKLDCQYKHEIFVIAEKLIELGLIE